MRDESMIAEELPDGEGSVLCILLANGGTVAVGITVCSQRGGEKEVTACYKMGVSLFNLR